MNMENPQFSTIIIPHAIYSTHKTTRRQIQTHRQQLQHTTSFLQRQAKKSARELEKKERSLMNYYKLKESRFEQSVKLIQKEKLRRKREEQLERQRKTNTLLRETSTAKKAMTRQNLLNMNHQSFSETKRDISQSERRLSAQKQLQNQLLRKRNSAFSRAVALGMEHAKVKTLFNKRRQSSQVKKDLILVQERIKNNEIRTIDHLNARQKDLLDVLEKNKKQKSHYDETFQKFQSVPFYQLYPVIKQTASKHSKSRRGSLKSETLVV